MPCGRRICRDRLDGGFCHGIESSWSSVESDVSSQPNFFIGGTISVQTATAEGDVVRRQGELKSAAARLNALIGLAFPRDVPVGPAMGSKTDIRRFDTRLEALNSLDQAVYSVMHVIRMARVLKAAIGKSRKAA